MPLHLQRMAVEDDSDETDLRKALTSATGLEC